MTVIAKSEGNKRRDCGPEQFGSSMELPQDDEARDGRLKTLIVLGKERGYLTYGEMNDHLPEMLEVEQIEGVVSIINVMGISVCDKAPDVENPLATDIPSTAVDENVSEAAEALLSTVSTEFCLSMDPVRMYMRDVGMEDLLSREDEIVIAKRIEEGLGLTILAISACPAVISAILALGDKVASDELRIDEVIDGFNDTQSDEIVSVELHNEELSVGDTDNCDGDEGLAAANLAKMKADAIRRFTRISDLFTEIGEAYQVHGYRSAEYNALQEKISGELMQFRFAQKQVEALCDTIRNLVERVRIHEHNIQELCISQAHMPRSHFIAAFAGNEANLGWMDYELGLKRPYCRVLAGLRDDVEAQQKHLLDLQQAIRLSIKDLKEIHKQMICGEGKARGAKRQMTEANLRLVISIARKYTTNPAHFLDLIQDGNIGLMKAVDRFNYRFGYKFSTYAVWWIRQAIVRSPDYQARAIRIPRFMCDTLDKINRFSRKILQETGTRATAATLALRMGMPEEKIRSTMGIAPTQISMSTPVGEDDDLHLGDVIEDLNTLAPIEAATHGRLRNVIADALDVLTPREAKILRIRFGIETNTDHTLREIGTQFGLTRERVRQIEAEALGKLRNSQRSEQLKGFWEEGC